MRLVLVLAVLMILWSVIGFQLLDAGLEVAASDPAPCHVNAHLHGCASP